MIRVTVHVRARGHSPERGHVRSTRAETRGRIMARKLMVEIYHDPDTESPADAEGAWTPYSFNSRHLSFRDPENFFPPDGELARKLEVGLAHVLSYFEHGNCVWMLQGAEKGMLAGDWQFDGRDIGGILIWEHDETDLGAMSKEDREKDAAAFVATYTEWCNGECYGFTVKEVTERADAEGLDEENRLRVIDEVDESGFIIGMDYLYERMFDQIEPGDEIVYLKNSFGITLDDVKRAREKNAAAKAATT